VCAIEQLRAARRVVGNIYIDDKVRDYIVHLVHATRDPRGLRPARARAAGRVRRLAARHDVPGDRGPRPRVLRHRAYVTPDDVKAIALDVLRHRVVITYEAEAEEITSEDVIRRVFEHLPVP
jgi:MoxR-like ATPase